MMFQHLVPRQRASDEAFEAPGRCIYCGAAEGLTLEHIIPDGLYGNLVIPAASCRQCQREIHKYESWVIQNHFGMARMAMGIHSKKKRKPNYRRSSTFRTSSRDAQVTRDRLAYPTMPLSITATHFNRRAAIFTGDMPRENDGSATLVVDNLAGEPDILHGKPFRILEGVKFVAKVAHGYAVACLGLDGFEPYLQKIIRNEDNTAGSWGMVPWYAGIIGQRGEAGGPLHRLTLRVETQSCSRFPQMPIAVKELVIVYLDMFIGYNLPTYEIVVGELPKGR